jgi:hypothetical protein
VKLVIGIEVLITRDEFEDNWVSSQADGGKGAEFGEETWGVFAQFDEAVLGSWHVEFDEEGRPIKDSDTSDCF